MQDAASMYEKAILPLDQSRCLEELGNFGKAISVLVDCSNFDYARECLKRFLSHKRSKVSWYRNIYKISNIVCVHVYTCFSNNLGPVFELFCQR